MTPTELLALYRYEVSDEEAPYLWSDAFVLGAIDDAQKQFCRDAYGIADARSFRLNIVIEKEWYVVDPRILKVRDAIDSTTGCKVRLVALEKMAAEGLRFDTAAGPLRALITGMEKNKLRAHPVPSVASTVLLHTFRLTETPVATECLELDEQHHRHLLMWVKHLAYDVQDSEVYDKKKSMEYAARFKAYCARALDEHSRLAHSAGCVVYGGY